MDELHRAAGLLAELDGLAEGLVAPFGEIRRDQDLLQRSLSYRLGFARTGPSDGNAWRCSSRARAASDAPSAPSRAESARVAAAQEASRAAAGRIAAVASCRSASRVATSGDLSVSTTKHGWGSSGVTGSYSFRKDSSSASVASETDGLSRRSASRCAQEVRLATRLQEHERRLRGARGVGGELAPAAGRERRVHDDAATRLDDLDGRGG